jgi:hypothetical protein
MRAHETASQYWRKAECGYNRHWVRAAPGGRRANELTNSGSSSSLSGASSGAPTGAAIGESLIAPLLLAVVCSHAFPHEASDEVSAPDAPISGAGCTVSRRSNLSSSDCRRCVSRCSSWRRPSLSAAPLFSASSSGGRTVSSMSWRITALRASLLGRRVGRECGWASFDVLTLCAKTVTVACLPRHIKISTSDRTHARERPREEHSSLPRPPSRGTTHHESRL